MLEPLLTFVLRPALAPMVRRHLRAQDRSGFNDRASFMGPRPVRVLILGAGLAVGYGPERGAEPLPMQLARAVGGELGRGVIVETRAQMSARLDRTVELIGMSGVARFDVVVWSPTLEEAVRAGSAGWTRQLRQVVAHIRRTGIPQVQIVLMGVPRVAGVHLLHRLGAAMAVDVNRKIEAVAAQHERTEFLPVPARWIESWDTPLLDEDYRRQVVGELARLLGDRYRREGARAVSDFRRAERRGDHVATRPVPPLQEDVDDTA